MPNVAALAAFAANRLPCSKYKINKIGPATIGSTTKIPATRGPQRRPASDEPTTNKGASSSFNARTVTGAQYHRCCDTGAASVVREWLVGLQESDEASHCRQRVPQLVRGQLGSNPVAEWVRHEADLAN